MNLTVAQVRCGAQQASASGLGRFAKDRAAARGQSQGQPTSIIIGRLSSDEPLLDKTAHDHAHRADIGVSPFGELSQRRRGSIRELTKRVELSAVDAHALLGLS
jgi:hypothetical protein